MFNQRSLTFKDTTQHFAQRVTLNSLFELKFLTLTVYLYTIYNYPLNGYF